MKKIAAQELPDILSLPYAQARKLIRTGDILLCSGNSTFSNLIKLATGSIWTHAGFIWRPKDLLGERCLVMESVEHIGVRVVPLSSYTNNYNGEGEPYDGKIVIARHADFKADMVHHLTGKAIDLLGHQYDAPEIMRILRKSLKSIIWKDPDKPVPPEEDSFYICSEYVFECFQECGITLNHNHAYVTPADIATDDKVRAICRIE